MSVDGVAGVQARIQEIQQQFDARLTTGGSSSSSSSTSNANFADLLAAASDLSSATSSTSDGTDTSTGTSSSFVNLLSQALGGSSNTALGGSLDSSSLANAIQSLS